MSAPSVSASTGAESPTISTETTPPGRFLKRFGWVLIGLASCLAYFNSFEAPFVYDGVKVVQQNEVLRKLTSFDDVRKIVAAAGARPLPDLTFALNYRFSELELPAWHATNLAIHLIAAWTLYGIVRVGLMSPNLRAFDETKARRLALLIALLWAVHPLQTQSVTYLVQRYESLMGMFYLLTLYATARFAATEKRSWSLLAILCCACGMGCKEVMVTAPFVTLWFDRVFLAPSWRELFRRRKWHYIALFATIAILAVLMVRMTSRYQKAGVFNPNKVTPLEYVLSEPSVVLHYLRLVVWPTGQNIDYAWKKSVVWPLDSGWPTSVEWGVAVPTVAAIVAILALGAVMMKRRPAVGFLIMSTFVILAPTSSVLPIADLAFEHRMYLSLAPVLCLLVVGFDALIGRLAARGKLQERERRLLAGAVYFTAVAALIALTIQRNAVYISNLSVWHDTVLKAPHNARAHYNLGITLNRLGADNRDEGLIDQAVAEYRSTLELAPDDIDSRVRLGHIAFVRGEISVAKNYFNEVVSAKPDNIWGWIGAARTALASGFVMTARDCVDKALEIDPENSEARQIVGELADAVETPEGRQRAFDFNLSMLYSRTMSTLGDPREATTTDSSAP